MTLRKGIPKGLPREQIEGLLKRMIESVPDKIDDAKLGELIRALVLLRQTVSEDQSELEVDTDGARARLEHLIARIADAETAGGDT